MKTGKLEGHTVPFYQYQYDEYKEIVSAEILMRPLTGRIDRLVRFLEEQNTVHHLDKIAFDWAIKFSDRFDIPCASNFSGKSLANKDVIERIAIAESSHQVRLELTENRDLSSDAIKNIIMLDRMGFEVSCDDFGSKWNGLNRLYKLPFKELKIDKFLVDELTQTRAQKIVRSTIELCRSLGITVVAEGVEEQWQYDMLKSMGCEVFQGYLLHKPEAFKDG